MSKQQSASNQTTQVNVLMMAAGTGGHVFPALAVAKQLTEQGATVHWLGTPTGMENDLVHPVGYPFHPINMTGLRGKGIFRLITLPFTLTNATLQALNVIIKNKIDVVVGFGGYVTAPGGIAAKLMGKPLIIHEQNAIAGMSNRYLGKIATKVMQAFANTFASDDDTFVTVGNPVRAEITQISPPNERFQTNDDSPLKLLVVGGSLGAQVLNQTMPAMLKITEKPLEVRHQCGKNNFESTQKDYQGVDTHVHTYTVMPFIEDMAEAYTWADIIVCRAGALTVTEIQNVGIPAIFVPLPHAVDDHQTANARYLSDAGAAYLLPQNQLSAESLSKIFSQIDRQSCLEMAIIGRQQANPDSTKKVAELIYQCIQ